MPQRKRKRLNRPAMLGRIQDLVGSAKHAYLDDRSPNRADRLLPLLDEAFDLCVQVRSAYCLPRRRKLEKAEKADE